MSEYQYGASILADVLSRANELGVGSADYEAEAKRYIQASYVSICGDFSWLWNRKSTPGVLNAVAEITAGSVTLTQNSTAGTFSVAPAASMAGRKIIGDTDGIVCRIASHIAAATSFTLDSAYQGTGGAGLSYRVFQDEYDLASDFLTPVNATRFLRDCHGSYDMSLIKANELDVLYPYPVASTGGRYCSIIREKKLRIAPYPTDARRYEYDYGYHPGSLTWDSTATDDLLIEPPEDGIVVALFATGHLLTDKDEDKAAGFIAGGQATLERMKRRARGQMKARLFMRPQFAVGTRR